MRSQIAWGGIIGAALLCGAAHGAFAEEDHASHLTTELNASQPTPEAPAPQEGQVRDRSLVCMIDDNLQRQPGIQYAYQGKSYYLCCQGCVRRFSAEPERFSHAIDPVSGQRVDKADAPIYAYDGQAFFFANDDHLRTFAQHPGSYLATPPPSEPAQ